MIYNMIYVTTLFPMGICDWYDTVLAANFQIKSLMNEFGNS